MGLFIYVSLGKGWPF